MLDLNQRPPACERRWKPSHCASFLAFRGTSRLVASSLGAMRFVGRTAHPPSSESVATEECFEVSPRSKPVEQCRIVCGVFDARQCSLAVVLPLAIDDGEPENCLPNEISQPVKIFGG